MPVVAITGMPISVMAVSRKRVSVRCHNRSQVFIEESVFWQMGATDKLGCVAVTQLCLPSSMECVRLHLEKRFVDAGRRRGWSDVFHLLTWRMPYRHMCRASCRDLETGEQSRPSPGGELRVEAGAGRRRQASHYKQWKTRGRWRSLVERKQVKQIPVTNLLQVVCRTARLF